MSRQSWFKFLDPREDPASQTRNALSMAIDTSLGGGVVQRVEHPRLIRRVRPVDDVGDAGMKSRERDKAAPTQVLAVGNSALNRPRDEAG